MYKFFITIFLLLSFCFNAFASDDTVLMQNGRLDGLFDIPNERKDDSCIPMYSFDRIINILTTMGIYYWFSNDFRMIHRDGETFASCENPVPPGGGVKYVYKPSFFGIDVEGLGITYTPPDPRGLKHGEEVMHGLVFLRGQEIGDMLCVQWLMTLGYRTIGCKYRQMPAYQSSVSDRKCWVDDQFCTMDVLSQSKSFIPITAPVIECVKKALYTFFLGDNSQNCETLLNKFQNNLRDLVKILLTLYVIFFGIRLSLVREISKGEAFLFIMKMLLVIYFSVGFKFGGSTNHGVQEVFNFFISAASGLSQIAVTAGNDSNLCMYTGYSPETKHLMAWDYLDCRMGYYLGINTIARTGANIIGSIATLLAIIFNPLFFIVALVVLIFALFFIGIVVHVVHSFLMSLVIITIVTFMAPIFVPMALFSQTKKMFDGWLQTLIGNTVKPVILMSFLAFMFAIMDNIMFPVDGCRWVQDSTQTTQMSNFMNAIFGTGGGRQWTMWKLEVRNDAPEELKAECRTSFGYLMQCVGTFGSAGCPAKEEIWQSLTNSMGSILQCLLFMFLFYFFIGMVDSIASDVAGIPSLGGAVGAMKMFEKSLGALGQIVKSGKSNSSKSKNQNTQRAGGAQNKGQNT